MSAAQVWRPAVEDLRRSWTARGRQRLGAFEAGGIRLVRRALAAGFRPTCLVLSEKELREPAEPVRALLNSELLSDTRIVAAPEQVVSELAGQRTGERVFALFPLPEWTPVAELVTGAQQKSAPLVGLVDVAEPGNVGALVRSALAGGASGLLLTGRSDPFHPKAVRTSMGGVFRLPMARLHSAQSIPSQVAPLPCWGAVAQGGIAPRRAVRDGAVTLLLGNEAQGLPAEVINSLHGSLTIPMAPGVDSFSVNAAAAILLYELAQAQSGSR